MGSYQMSKILLAIAVVACSKPALVSAGTNLSGRWWTPLGVMKIKQKGKKITGRVSWKCRACPFKRGETIFQGLLLEDSLAGKVRYCLKGKDCQGDGWAPLVLLVARGGRVLSGAAYYKTSSCQIGGKGKKEGLVMRKLKPLPKKPKPPKQSVAVAEQTNPDNQNTKPDSQAAQSGPTNVVENGEEMETEVKPSDPKQYAMNAKTWQAAMEQAAAQMNAGFFERARRLFRQATKLDPTRPESFNGIGVTYYARSDLEEALNWYKKSLEVDPDFGDAYYNMACIYSLLKKPNLAFRYLEIAALNGFIQPKVFAEDPDLANLHTDPRFRKLIKQMVK